MIEADALKRALRRRSRLQFVTAREASLFLFHALGKVLYSKSEHPPQASSRERLLTILGSPIVGWGEDLEDDVKDTRPKPPVTDPLPDHLRTFDKRLSKVDPNVRVAPIQTTYREADL